MNESKRSGQNPPLIPPKNVEEARLHAIAVVTEQLDIARSAANQLNEKDNRQSKSKRQWMQIAGYLSQTLQTLLHAQDINETREALAKIEKEIIALRDEDSKSTAGTSAEKTA